MENIGIYEHGDKLYSQIVNFCLENNKSHYIIYTINEFTDHLGYRQHFNINDFIDDSLKIDPNIAYLKSKDFFKENITFPFIQITDSVKDFEGLSYFYSFMNHLKNNSLTSKVTIITKDVKTFTNRFNPTINTLSNPFIQEIEFIWEQLTNGQLIVTVELNKEILDKIFV